MEIWGVKVDTKALKDLSDGFGADLRPPRKDDLRAGRHGVQHQLAPTAGGHPLPQAQPPATKKTKINQAILDLDRHPPGAGPPPSAGPVRPRVQAGGQAQIHLRRRPARSSSTPRRAGSTPRTTRRSLRRAAILELTPTSRTSRPGASSASASGGPSSRKKGSLFLAADYSQIELRILAHLSGDPALVEIFLEDRDIHEETAVPGLRRDRRTLQGRDETPGQDHQFLDHLRHLGVLAGQGAGDVDRGSPEVHRPLLRKIPEGLGISGKAWSKTAHDKGYLRDHLRTHPSGARAQASGQDHPAGGAPHRPQQAHPGLGRRHHEEGHARRLGAR